MKKFVYLFFEIRLSAGERDIEYEVRGKLQHEFCVLINEKRDDQLHCIHLGTGKTKKPSRYI